MSAPAPLPGILDIKPYVGGASRATAQPGVRIARLASNESPLGPSPRAIEAFKAAADSLHLYPDGGVGALRGALAEHHGIDAAGIVCGNGSDELLALLAKCYAGPGDEVVISEFGFLIYPIAARSAGATPVVAPERQLRVDVEALQVFAEILGSKSTSRHPRYGALATSTWSTSAEETQWRTWNPESLPELANPWRG